MTTAPSQSAEDYLERILELIQETGQARVVDTWTNTDQLEGDLGRVSLDGSGEWY